MLRLGRRTPRLVLSLTLVLGLTTPVLALPRIRVDAAQFGNVFVQGESPTIEVTVTADADAGYRGPLFVTTVDAYGRSAGRLRRKIDVAPGASSTTAFTLSPRGLGHVALVAAIGASSRRPSVAAYSAVAIVPPIVDTPAETSAVGYFVYPLDHELPYADGLAQQMRRLGIRWVRFGFRGWDDARLDPPSNRSDPDWFDTTGYERWVDAFRAQGISVLTTLFGMPRWASSLAHDDTPVAGLPTWTLAAPYDLSEWRLVVRTLAERLQGRVHDWEVWNEPNHYLYWQSSALQFAALVRATAETLRDVDPTARVVVNYAPSLLGPFEEDVITGAGDQIDVFGWHYAHREQVQDAIDMLPHLRSGAVVWDTEASGSPRRHINQWLEARSSGTQRLFPFIYRLNEYEGEGTPAARFGRYPVNIDYTPRLDAVTLRTLSDAVGNAPSITGVEAGIGYWAFTPNGVDDRVVVLVDMNEPGETWFGPPGLIVTVEVPAGVHRLLVTDLMGNQRAVRVRRGKARIRSLGIAEFLRAEPADALTSVRVVDLKPAGR
jgi:hypothetical protein